jgi:hypothetical protein
VRGLVAIALRENDQWPCILFFKSIFWL